MSVAARVAEEMGVKLGNEVQHIRYSQISLMIKHPVCIQSTLRTASTILLLSLIYMGRIILCK